MKSLLKSLPVALLILVFVYAAVSKLIAFRAFGAGLHAQPFPPVVAEVLRYMLPAAELAVAAMLLFPRSLWYGLMASLALLVSFTGYIGFVLIHLRGAEPCSCGGILNHMSWSFHLAFNLFFIVLNLIAIHNQLKERRPAV